MYFMVYEVLSYLSFYSGWTDLLHSLIHLICIEYLSSECLCVKYDILHMLPPNMKSPLYFIVSF